jgi:hypothetical protein
MTCGQLLYFPVIYPSHRPSPSFALWQDRPEKRKCPPQSVKGKFLVGNA